MLDLLAQTTQPNLPGIDPSWLSWPGVKTVVAVGIVTAAALLVFNKLLMPLMLAALKSFGLLKRTWKEEMEAKVQAVAENTAILNLVVDKSSPVGTVPSSVAAKTEMIGTGNGGPSPDFR